MKFVKLFKRFQKVFLEGPGAGGGPHGAVPKDEVAHGKMLVLGDDSSRVRVLHGLLSSLFKIAIYRL